MLIWSQKKTEYIFRFYIIIYKCIQGQVNGTYIERRIQVQGWDTCSCSRSLTLDRSICIYFPMIRVCLWDLFSQNSLDLINSIQGQVNGTYIERRTQVQGWDTCSRSLTLDGSMCIYFPMIGVCLWDLFSQNSLDLINRNQVFINWDKFYLTTWWTHFPWRRLSKGICIKRVLIPIWHPQLKLIPWWIGIGTGWFPSNAVCI